MLALTGGKKILEEIVSKEKGACLNWWKKKSGGNSEQGKKVLPLTCGTKFWRKQ